MKRLIISIILIIPLFSFSQEIMYSGVLIDKDDKTTIPFASIWLEGNTYGVMSDDKGKFSLKLRKENDTIVIRAFGYKLQIVETKKNKKENKIMLIPLKTTLPEVNVEGMGPKAILTKALRSVDENFLKKETFYLNMESLMKKKINDSLVYLRWDNDVYERRSILGLKLLLPNYSNNQFISNEEKYHSNYMSFSIDDIVYYYMVYILNSNFMAKGLEGQKNDLNFGYSMKIIMQDSIEKEYIVSLHQKKELDNAFSSLHLPKTIRFFIDAETMVITKIESSLDKSKPRVFFDKKKGKFEVKEHIVVVNFRVLDGKYFLSNCFSKVIFNNDRENAKENNSFLDSIKKDDLNEEVIIYNTKQMKIKPDKFEKIKSNKTILPIQELKGKEIFEAILD
ncbi:MAG: carboxypeptidase-like regulatory domain-containing protein [Bacteroidales bacterium]|nr:carboxypeptidase-like regulatory domain-containing protein [Bacteroidales bacterium]